MKVEDYFAMFDIESDEDQKKRFLEPCLKKVRRWASTINIDELDGYKYDDKYTKEQKENPSNGNFLRDLPRKEGLPMQLLKLGEILSLILPKMTWKNL